MKNNYIKSERMWNVCLSYVYRMFYVISILFTFGVGQTWGTKKVWIDVTSAPSGYTSNMIVQYYVGSSWTSVWAQSYGSVGSKTIYYADIADGATKWQVYRGDDLKLTNTYNWQWEMTYSGANMYKVTGWNNSGDGSKVIGMVTGGYMYYDDHLSDWSGTANKYFVIGHDSYYGNHLMTNAITNTKLWYFDNNSETWADAKYFAFFAHTGEYPSASKAWSDIDTHAAHKTAQYTSNYNLVNNGHYLCIPSASGDRKSFTISSKSAYTDLNHRITIKEKYNSSGSTPWAEVNAGTTHGTISAAGYKFGSWTACNTESSATVTKETTTYSAYADFGYTNTVRLTAGATKAGKAFVGWYDNSGTRLTTSTTYDLVVTGATTVWAYYKDEETHDVTVSYKCSTDEIKTSTTESAVGVSTTRTVTAPTLDDYVFSSWSLGADVISTNGTSTNPIIIKTRASGSTFTLTANYTRKTCKLYEPSGPKSGSSTDRGAMNYSLSEKAYYKDVTASAQGIYRFRFYHNGSTEYSSGWEGDYVSGKRAYANGDKIVCDQSVGGWTDRPAMYFEGIASSNIRIWFDYANKKAWITEATYAVSFNNGDHGTVSPSGSQSVGKNSGKSITATPATGWKFVNWTKTGSAVLSSTTTNPTTVTATGTGSVTPTYAHKYVLRGSKNGDDATTGGMAGWTATDNSSYSTATISDGVLTITANLTLAKTKYKMKIYDTEASQYYSKNSQDWTGNNNATLNTSDGSDITFTTTAPGTYTFTFNCSSKNLAIAYPSPVYTVTYGVQSGSGTVTAKVGNTDVSIGATPGKVVSGTDVKFTASDGTGYQFSKWVGGSGTQVSTSNPYTKSNITANCTIKAVFTARNYTAANNLKEADDTNNGQYNVTYDNTSIAHTSAPSRTGYTVEGYYKQAAWTNKIANTDLSLVSSSAYTKSGTNKWNQTSAPNLYIKWQQTLTLAGNGAGSTNGRVTTTYLGTASSHTAATRTGYTLNGYYDNTSGGNKILTNTGALVTYSASVSDYINSSGKWIYDGTPTLSAQWTANTYTITLDHGVNGSGSGTATIDYDAGSCKSWSDDISQTGYHVSGWYAPSSSTKVLNDDHSFAASNVAGYITSGQWKKADNCTLQAWWDPNNYTVTLDKQSSAPGHSTDGSVGNQSVYYNTALPSISGTAPTAINGWAFMGFYTATGGEGVQVIDANLNWVASVDGYTDADSKWKHADNVTLYAYYKKAEITGITFSTAGVPGSVIAPSTSTTATATISPTPTGTTTICWRILHSNGNPLEEQPTFDPETGAAVSFTTSATSGSYLIEARLRLGSGCSGTVLDSVTSVFQVAGDHNVTVQYKDASGNTIKASEIVTGRPLAWSSAIEAPEIFGYTFSQWEAVDGVTISTDGTNPIVGSTTSTRTIYIKAVYDGRIVAKYNKKDFIYFKNTLGWDNNSVYVYFYKNGGYWDDSKGAGATGDACIGKGKMSLVDGETDILYWDYGAGITGGAAAATKYIAFTAGDGRSHGNFNGFDVVYPVYGNAGEQGFNPGTPMFVPLAKNVQPNPNYTKNGSTPYFQRGYWTKYSGGTGYSIDIFFSKGGGYDKSVNFVAGATPDMPYTATVDLSGGTTLGFKVHRANNIYYYTSTDVTMSNASTAKNLTFDSGATNQTGITTTAAGDYVFTLTCAASGELQISVKYPVAAGDYRVLYKDGVHTGWKPSAVVPKVNNGKDTVSFFIRPGSSPQMKIQQASIVSSTLTWNEYSTVTSSTLTSLPKDSVYNICLTMNGSGGISVGNVEAYTGNFYIRTDAANNKWDNYKAADHMMTYSEYSEHNSDFSHYWMAHVTATSSNKFNVKYVVANDYSPCISDTLIQSTYRGGDSDHVNATGYISAEANIRFMWKRSTNEVYRAYLAPAQSDGSKFLVLRGQTDDNLLDVEGNALRNASNNNHLGGDYCMQFVDNENWIYETTVKVIPSSYVKLFALFDGENFYYKGANNNTFNGSDSGDGYHTPNAIQLITGSGEAQLVRVIYDFKTDRLVAAFLPSGNITENMDINADVMFIREHQGDIAQLTFSGSGSLTEIKTAYGVIRFNKWTLNNKEKTGEHSPLASPLSRYERDLFYISFPFRVNLNEVFGFGTYGVHWILEYYDGAGRAEKGFWKDSPTFWKFVTNRNGFILEPNVGYLLALDLDQLGEESAVWNNRVENVELFFPSCETMPDIKSSSVTHTLPQHECTINRPTPQGDRRISDSHWNIMSVPTYVNVNNPSFTNSTWKATIGPKFLYTWNADDNTLTPTTAAGFNYHAMHAYTVQYYGNVTWTSSVSPSSIVARKQAEPSAYEWCLELQQNDKMIDRTYVRMSDEEEVTTGFEFGYDMSKSIEWAKANIYTFIGTEWVAGNSLPLETEQTTIIPVGLTLAAAGDYTFAMPAGTHGVGVTLVDTQTNERTNLSAGMTQTVTLTQGDHLDRFFLEISPIHNAPTDIGLINGENGVNGANGARKVLIDGILYIVKGDKLYDVRGTMIK